MFSQLIINGISSGSLYALVALAMVIIYKASEVPNFAQGEMATLSVFVAWHFVNAQFLPFYQAVAAALLFAFAVGVLFEFTVLRRAEKPSILELIVMTLGLQMFIYGIIGWKWGAEQKTFSLPIAEDSVVQLGPVVIGWLNIITIVTSLLCVLLLYLFFTHTKLGTAMRAVQMNSTAARINGIRVHRIMSLTWGLSAVIGTIAGILFAPVSPLDPQLMWDPLLKGFAAGVLGGMTSPFGAVLGGYILGIIENLFGAYISLEFKSVVAFALIVLVLWFKPSGLFSRHYERKV
ncbi:MAG TPA: branched-chain amino acid ABC transporter permease [Bacteroidetes bacterium]|nr:branched-chain amino acid ABC transporter permease [Bacteroidota bacterium]